MSFLPRFLKEEKGYDYVALDTNHKGWQIFAHNPFIDKLIYFNPHSITMEYMLYKRWEALAEDYDAFFNLFRSLEYNCIAMEDQAIYYMGDKKRREFGKGNFYDKTLEWCGFPEYKGKYKGEVYYTDKEHAMMKRYVERFKDKFTVMLNLSGSGPHKSLIQGAEIINMIRKEVPNVHFITTGDKLTKHLDCSGDDITSIAGIAPFREALLMAKYMNCVIGCESGIMVGANMWGVPTIQLMTSSSQENHPNSCDGDYSLQSPAHCSPCHKGPYRYLGCPRRDGYALCTWFNVDEILEKVKEIYGIYTHGKS